MLVAEVTDRRSQARRRPKPSPATQMRVMLAALRRDGIVFERAWESAFTRIRWPHATEQRIDWKELLLDQRGYWQEAYERTGASSPRLLAVYSLLVAVSEAEDRSAWAYLADR